MPDCERDGSIALFRLPCFVRVRHSNDFELSFGVIVGPGSFDLHVYAIPDVSSVRFGAIGVEEVGPHCGWEESVDYYRCDGWEVVVSEVTEDGVWLIVLVWDDGVLLGWEGESERCMLEE